MVQGSERPAVQRKRRGSEGAENRRLWLIKREGEVLVMQKEEMESLAREAGFTNTAVIPADQLVFDPSLRKYCEDNLCGNYGKNYSCPPECGTPEEMKARTEQYRLAWIFQTIAEADWKDAAALKAVRDGHNARSRRLIGELRKRGEEGLAMLAGPCSACEVCASAGGSPCNFPEEQVSCISAYCMSAEKMADTAGIPYWCGEGRVAFFSLYLMGRKEG